MKSIKLGYEAGTGKPVDIPLSHLIVTGVTQASGKTTTLEALIDRSNQKVIVFTTKPGEKSFQTHGPPTRPFFKERCDWRYVETLLEASMRERMKYERLWIIKISRRARNLDDVYNNILAKLKDDKVSKSSKDAYELLKEYFDLFLPDLRKIKFDKKLRLKKGLNIMALEEYRDEIQSLIINSVLEEILKNHKNTIVVIPEAWKFIPQKRADICKDSALAFVRQGATNGNYLWIDSQDMTNTDKAVLKQVTIWILGLQREINEVKRTLAQIPQSKPTVKDIMTLPRGHFYACMPDEVRKVYVQPKWLSDSLAKDIAIGKKAVSSINPPITRINKPIVPPKEDRTDDLEGLERRMEELERKIQNIPKEPSQDLVGQLFELVERIDELEDLKNMKQEIVDEILKSLPRSSSGGQVAYKISPLEKIQKDFVMKAKDKVLADVKTLDPTEKKILKFMEMQARGLKKAYLVANCLHLKAGGSSSEKVEKILRKLIALELVRKDSSGKHYPELKVRIRGLLGSVKAGDKEVQQVYDHILMEILK